MFQLSKHETLALEQTDASFGDCFVIPCNCSRGGWTTGSNNNNSHNYYTIDVSVVYEGRNYIQFAVVNLHLIRECFKTFN